MRSPRHLTFLGLALGTALGCGTSAEPSPEPTRIDEGPLPPPVEVCIVESTGHHARATVTPHHGGMFDRSMPVRPESLNWMDSGGHCVTPPVGDIPRVPCPEGDPIPLVTPRLCGR